MCDHSRRLAKLNDNRIVPYDFCSVSEQHPNKIYLGAGIIFAIDFVLQKNVEDKELFFFLDAPFWCSECDEKILKFRVMVSLAKMKETAIMEKSNKCLMF